MASSHAAGLTSVCQSHLHVSQAFLGLVLIYESSLPLLYAFLWKRWTTALKCPFLFVNYERSIGIYTVHVCFWKYRLQVQSSQNAVAEIVAADTREKFLWISGKSGFHFISFLIATASWFSTSKMLSTVRGTTKAPMLSRMGCQDHERRNKTKKKGKGREMRSIDSYLLPCGCYLISL